MPDFKVGGAYVELYTTGKEEVKKELTELDKQYKEYEKELAKVAKKIADTYKKLNDALICHLNGSRYLSEYMINCIVTLIKYILNELSKKALENYNKYDGSDTIYRCA